MKHCIDDETIEYVGILSKLELSPTEREQAKKDIEQMLGYVDLLNELDTENVEPLFHAIPLEMVLRSDDVVSSDPREEILKNAPREQDGMFVVPRTIGE